MRYLQAGAAIIAVLVLSATANAVTLYATTAAGASGELYSLDPANGAVLQDIGPLNDASNVNYPITGLAFNPLTGVLFGSTGNSVPATAATLVTIDPATAKVTVVGPFNVGNTGNPATMADLEFDSAGNLYGVGSVGGPNLYKINLTTGQATGIGSTGLTSTSGGGLAISSAGVFYGTPTSSRYGTYDSTTGAYTNIANPDKPAGTGAYTALAYNGSTLYGLNTGPGSPPPTHIVTINPTTGAVTDLGASLNSLDAIVFSLPPASLVGDYNNNGKVDAGDYVIFRNNSGTTNVLPNDPLGGTIGIAQYNQWKSHFGDSHAASGSARVPEPTSLALVVLGAVASVRFRHAYKVSLRL